VARAVVGRPKVVLLDEPAAGLPDDETGHLAEVIRRIPEHTGALTILVDHERVGADVEGQVADEGRIPERDPRGRFFIAGDEEVGPLVFEHDAIEAGLVSHGRYLLMKPGR
jgi:ABC-type branched-subunit amino acid transport system ATPase component